MLGRGRSARALGALVALITGATMTAGGLPASGAGPRRIAPSLPAGGFQGEHAEATSVDSRSGAVSATSAQRAVAARLGAEVRWNRFGTPQSLIRYGGFLSGRLSGSAVGAARAWLGQNHALFRLTRSEANRLELVSNVRIGRGRALLFRQRFAGLSAAHDGSLAMAVVGGRIAYVSSAITGDSTVTNSRNLSLLEAYRVAARDAGVRAGTASRPRVVNGWTRFDVARLSHPQSARLVALPTPTNGVRLAYQVSVADIDAEPVAFTTFVDAESGDVLIRESNVDHEQDNPKWEVFPNIPRLDYSSSDTRETWCWTSAPGCDRVVANAEARNPWDVDARTGVPTNMTRGNAARTTEKWDVAQGSVPGVNFATSPTRDYTYSWTNQWFEESCNPETFTSPERNDIDAAIANLFVMHNRMHDWAYRLGFTEETWNAQDYNFGVVSPTVRENDPEHGNAQAGARTGSRDNANQFTPPDGQLPVTNMFLWQPLAGGFYAPCVDGDYDMSVIGHEYTHAISNRMVAGPDQRLVGAQANAMGEAWSDLTAIEYLLEYGFVPAEDENPFAVGPYVTSNHVSGIRNYGMNFSPLNYSNIGYDIVGVQVHADGEIWSATNYDIRKALNERYGTGSSSLQRRCADGQVPVSSCPGNRRWIQILFSAYLLMPPSGEVSMVDARDAYLAADMAEFGGRNQDVLWNAFAGRGFGEEAVSAGVDDPDPKPSFESPQAREATVRFKPVDDDGDTIKGAQLFVGNYEARSVAVADTDPATETPDTFKIVPGNYSFVTRADGFGMHRTARSLKRGDDKRLTVEMETNLASVHNGAVATGDGTNLEALIDDTEATNWASLDSPVVGKQVTVALQPSRRGHEISRVHVSAMLRPQNDPDDPNDPPQSRFSALRQFKIFTCLADRGRDCSQDSHFRLAFTSRADAFPAVAPRPIAPNLILRSFSFRDVKASHVRLVVVTNQCTGTPAYQGEQDADPANVTDCEDGSTQDDNVRAAELQVFE